MNEIVVNIRLSWTTATSQMITGYRGQHNNVQGPFKGGLRFHPPCRN
jgi:glutamate dehydrogenase (NAD(P)+)